MTRSLAREPEVLRSSSGWAGPSSATLSPGCCHAIQRDPAVTGSAAPVGACRSRLNASQLPARGGLASSSVPRGAGTATGEMGQRCRSPPRWRAPVESLSASLRFEHCVAALDRSLAVGAHGLPLIGSGDWNDGMNRVGQEGRGESVWLGWFLYAVLAAFAPIAEERGERPRANRWRARMRAVRRALESQGWDGDWYRRAFFDDGTPLGSAINAECRIDSIAQSWAVLSGAAPAARAERAMAAVDEFLVRRGDGLVLLFTPPFDRSDVDPGYVKG